MKVDQKKVIIVPPASINTGGDGPGGLLFAIAILAIVILSSVSGCATKIRCAGKYPCVVKDSITVQIVEKVKEVTIKDTSRLRYWLPSPCDTGKVKPGFSMIVETDKGTTAILKEHNGGLQVSTGINGVKSKAAVTDTSVTKFITVRVNCDRNHQTGFETFLIYSGGIAWVIFLLLAGWRVLRLLPH